MRKTLFAVICLFLAVPCPGRIITVDCNGPADFNNIQAAINDANDDDTVVVLPGAYTGPGNRDIDFLGKAITVRSTDPNDPNIVAVTVIDCNGTKEDPHRGFWFHSGEGTDSILAGLTITNGFSREGAGIYCYGSGPTIARCVLSENATNESLHAGSYGAGGGIYCRYGTPAINGCIFSRNMAPVAAGMGSEYSSPNVTDCTFTGNLGSGGSGIANLYSSPAVTNCRFSGNTAEATAATAAVGGGMVNDFSDAVVTDCVFRGNAACTAGGGMANFESSPIVTNCTFVDNVARSYHSPSYGEGGGICSWESNLVVESCTFRGNSAVTGGAMLLACDQSNLANCVFAGNSADQYGGAMELRECDANVVNCVFIGNCAPDGNALACNPAYYPSTFRVTNCILWDGGNEVWKDDDSAISISYSDVRSGWPGEGNIDADPCFVEPGYWDANGTSDDPNDDFWVDGDYHFLPGSPCIDTGDNNALPPDTYDLDGDGNTAEPIPFDLDGNPRVVDGDNDGNAVVDMGAYEYFVPPIEVYMKFTPQALNPYSSGRWVKAHFVLPEEFTIDDVDTGSPAKITVPFEPDIESEYMNVFVNEASLVEIEAGFDRGEFCAAGIDGNSVELTAVGSLTTGQLFYGTETIRITSNYLKYLADLASYWLRSDCDKPDWCGGLDLDRNSRVDFVDFALFDGCCIEVVAQ